MSSWLHFVQQTRKPWMQQMDQKQQSQNRSDPRTDSTSPMKCKRFNEIMFAECSCPQNYHSQ
uniref:Uncharacterized protein n=1 Tax=Arundo donax TaxID=35708 RepID=A0A0A9ES89_ARUDO